MMAFETAKLKESLREMSANKAPGPDGLPPEFYLAFFDDIAPFILMVFNASQYLSVVPES